MIVAVGIALLMWWWLVLMDGERCIQWMDLVAILAHAYALQPILSLAIVHESGSGRRELSVGPHGRRRELSVGRRGENPWEPVEG